MVGKVFKVVFSPKARRRLNQITDYLEEVASKAVARKVRNNILDAADKLKQLPASKPILPDTEDVPFEVRYAKSYSYKLIFRIETTADTVRILNISHDAEDPDRISNDL
ncbi:type II toxin-antitoxin system RelE/ParE family toxin [Neolewinella antarctica]|uniref:Plasmid stabilization system protein ParE n=1 Tax=Neolewinella antarctica TaxID=442734 RepID=A0ABX0XEH5_9BACT|nr:type II toxin-antitoxin system RelE/ParE family toxin [Neolewinella antarctica]NJC27500.1 plasmid stabilization system protein ParE [Neolewinella antarctica]